MNETISVLVSDTDPTKGIFGDGRIVPLEIPVERLKASLSDLVAKLTSATSELVAKADGFSLKELEVSIEITSEGGINLIGTVKAGANASLKLTFERN